MFLTHMPHQYTLPRHTLAALLAWYDALSPSSLAHLDQYYAQQARFCAPFNDVKGIAAIRAIFEHMFESVEAPRFAVQTKMSSGAEAFVSWRFTGKVRQQPFDGLFLRVRGPTFSLCGIGVDELERYKFVSMGLPYLANRE